MNRRPFRVISAAAVLVAALSLSLPALADGHGHGNGGGGGGGGSSAARGGGGSMARGGGPSGGRAGGAQGGFSGGHAAGPAYGGGQFGGGRSMAPSYRGSQFSGARSVAPAYRGSQFNGARSIAPANRGFTAAPGARYGYSTGRVSSSPRFNNGAGFRPSNPNYAGRGGFNRPVHGIGVGGRPRSWGGGSFHGSYWPRSYYHSGFVRFFPILPAFYSTYWWGGVPYYYWDDAYYTWSSSDSGYVATDPPPVVDDGASSDSGSAGDPSSLYVYPKNGQSEEQTSTDRYECHQWAVGQTGFDPTSGADQSAAAGGASDYQRAIAACLDARGYSAR